ncbi:RNA polymerase sigma factor [Desertivirga brevis]|uniref:RNA polymerase sigma factor n=1 Tax=Desertivirga brevis TaxID=2810310 RepID=UPI001F625BE0|nr:RNA polymerase sigma-70 factor [Pedobacter sp. SYSU D00873]
MMLTRDTAVTEERALIEQLREGEILAFEDLYNKYKRPLSMHILRLVKSQDIAEDILHDLFIKVWHHRSRLNPDRSFKSYLYRIAENLVVDLFRRAALDQKFRNNMIGSMDLNYSHIEESLDIKEKKQLLDQALHLLPPQCRLVFTLCKIEGKTSEEVANQLNVSQHTISNHLAKASKVLRRFLILNMKDTAPYSLIFLISRLLN